MDRGTWQATVHRVTRVRHNLVTKQKQQQQQQTYIIDFTGHIMGFGIYI